MSLVATERSVMDSPQFYDCGPYSPIATASRYRNYAVYPYDRFSGNEQYRYFDLSPYIGKQYNGRKDYAPSPMSSNLSVHSSSSSSSPPLSSHGSSKTMSPSWFGFVDDTHDIATLFEAAISGRIPVCERRPHDREKLGLIQNGAVVIYDEDASGIKRWTDARSWSPSRVLGKFLVYREVNKTDSTGKKQVAKKNAAISVDNRELSTSPLQHPVTDEMRTRVGSLIGTYDFIEDGLVKRTATCLYQGRKYHLVSYFSLNEYQYLQRPRCDPNLADIHPSAAVLSGLKEGEKQTLGEPHEDYAVQYPQSGSTYTPSSSYSPQSVPSYNIPVTSSGYIPFSLPSSTSQAQSVMGQGYLSDYHNPPVTMPASACFAPSQPFPSIDYREGSPY